MRSLLWLNAISGLVLLVTATTAPAQDIFVTPTPGVPFSATVNVERALTRPDGSAINLKTIRDIGRDSGGVSTTSHGHSFPSWTQANRKF